MPKKSRLLDPLPWYAWNPRQWQASRKVQNMDWAARGIYRELMDECWFKRFIPVAIQGLAELLDADPGELEHSYPQFIRCFEIVGDGTMFSPFIETVRTEAAAFRLAQARRRQGRSKADTTPVNHGEPRITLDNPGEPRTTPDNRGPAVHNSTGHNSTVPPTPLKGERKPRRTRAQIIEPYSEAVRTVANAVLAPGFWRSQDPDGRRIEQDPAKLCINLDLIFRENPGLPPETLVKAARSYLDKPRQRYSAAQWFFGRGSEGDPAHWFTEVRMIQHQASRAGSAQGGTPHGNR